MADRTFGQLCFVILMNEIKPRAKKHGHWPPVEMAGLLARLEFDKDITRRELRQYLDDYYANL